ncbi:MAG: hypothetical protein ACLT3Y_00100 [Ruminococcus callidus]
MEQLLLELEQENSTMRFAAFGRAVQLLAQEQARLNVHTAARTAAQNAEKLPELQEKATLLQHSLPAYKAAQLSAQESALQKDSPAKAALRKSKAGMGTD